jgi:hypothetical protein
VPCYIYRVWSDVPQVAIACSLLYKSDSMFQRSLNLRRPSWLCHGDGWRQAVAAILKCELTFTRDVTFVQPGYPISSIPKTLSRKKCGNVSLTWQWVNNRVHSASSVSDALQSTQFHFCSFYVRPSVSRTLIQPLGRYAPIFWPDRLCPDLSVLTRGSPLQIL